MSKLVAIKAKQKADADNPYNAVTTALVETGKLNGLTHYQAQLVSDLARLKGIKDIPAKIEAKRGMVDNYRLYIKDFLASGQRGRNDVAVTVMIWLFDIADIDSALPLALTLIEQGQAMPESFGSSMPTFVCDYVYDWAVKLLPLNQSASPYLDSVVEAIDLFHWDLPIMVSSKMYALLAKFKFNDERYADVVALCDQAKAVNPDRHGTKTLRAKAQAKLQP